VIGKLLGIVTGHLLLEWKDRSNLFWMLIMPIAFIGIFGSMFRGDPEGRASFSLAVVDEDDTFLSGRLIETLEAEQFDVEVLAPASADTTPVRVRRVTIPAGFSDNLALGIQVGLELEANPENDSSADITAEVHLYQSIARMLTALAAIDTSAAAGRLDVESTGFQERFREQIAVPDLIEARSTIAERWRQMPRRTGASAQSMLILFLLMNPAISGAVVLTRERQSRVLARLATLPISRAGLLAGKVLGMLALGLIQSLIILVLGTVIFGVDWGNNPIALLLLLICFGLAAAALGIFLGAFLRTPEQASAIGWIIPLFLGAIGGCWWPLEVTPSWMQTLGHISPAAWAMDGMHGLISFGKGAAAIVVPCFVLLGYAAVLTGIGARLLRTSE
jgi:ABC-type Na+ efflux pump permease subunit